MSTRLKIVLPETTVKTRYWALDVPEEWFDVASAWHLDEPKPGRASIRRRENIPVNGTIRSESEARSPITSKNSLWT